MLISHTHQSKRLGDVSLASHTFEPIATPSVPCLHFKVRRLIECQPNAPVLFGMPTRISNQSGLGSAWRLSEERPIGGEPQVIYSLKARFPP
jgi:hypothetical protein